MRCSRASGHAGRTLEVDLPSQQPHAGSRAVRSPAGDIALAIDTSTPLGSVALAHDGRLLGEVVIGEHARHSETLLPAVRFLLDAADAPMAAVGTVVVGAGPGSFTGVRIAAATAKGLAHALGVPLLAFSSLAATAASAAQQDRPVCALFDARRDEVYAACYRFPGLRRFEQLVAPAARPLDELLRLALPLAPLFAGEGAVRHADAIGGAGGLLAPPHLGVPRAAALLWLAAVAGDAARVDVEAWEPEYLRPSGAERRAS